MLKLDLNPKRQVLAQFAWIAVAGLPLLTGLVLRWTVGFTWDHPVFLGIAGFGVLQLLLFLVGVQFATKVAYVALTLVAMPIGFVISHVLLATIYYLMFTPLGLLFRLVGRDQLGKKLEPQRPSYWHDRGPPKPASSYFKLY